MVCQIVTSWIKDIGTMPLPEPIYLFLIRFLGEKTSDIWGITWTRNDKDVWHYIVLVHYTNLMLHWLNPRQQQLHC